MRPSLSSDDLGLLDILFRDELLLQKYLRSRIDVNRLFEVCGGFFLPRLHP